MNIRWRRWLLVSCVLFTVLLVVPALAASDLIEDRVVVDRQDAKTVDIEIIMGAGDLTIDGGAYDLLEAEFIYNREDWKPEVDYWVSNKRGRLSVNQPSDTNWNSIFNLGNTYYEWNLRLQETMPMQLEVKLGAGEANLHLGDLLLSRLDVKLGVGDVTIDLTGEWEDDLQAYIKGGVGQAVLKLPDDVGVRVYVKKGIGSVSVIGMKKNDGYYTNQLYGKAKVNLEIEVIAGIGEVQIEVVD
ncbi:MAG: toast rack family protein [Halanaerobium sp.]|nr:toast rack family protein [Halanaerobium sp.]